jgi:hypothetical protein
MFQFIMGNEHSSQQPGQPTRSKSMIRTGSKGSAGPENADLQDDIRSSSPGPSVCSDSELPYISYTVSRPIGGLIASINLINASLIDMVFKNRLPQAAAKASAARQVRLVVASADQKSRFESRPEQSQAG